MFGSKEEIKEEFSRGIGPVKELKEYIERAIDTAYKRGYEDRGIEIEKDICIHDYHENANPYKTEYTCRKCGHYYEE